MLSRTNEIEVLAKKHRGLWREELCESEDIEIFGQNEYFGGKAEAYEDCLEILKKKNV
jgi:hypothetical protein